MRSSTICRATTRSSSSIGVVAVTVAIIANTACGARPLPSAEQAEAPPQPDGERELVDAGEPEIVDAGEPEVVDAGVLGTDAEVAQDGSDVVVREWSDAPKRCSGKVGTGLRPETAFATVVFVREVWRRLQGYAQADDNLNWLLREMSMKPAAQKFLVVPAGYGFAQGGQVAESPVLPMTRAFEGGERSYVARLDLVGAVNDGPSEEPMLGSMTVMLYYNKPRYIGNFGGTLRFCVVPRPGKGPEVFVERGVEF